MADTWRATAQGVSFASGRFMIDVFNASGSGRVIKIRRAYQFNNGLVGVVGVLTSMRCMKLITSAPTGGTSITPVSHDTNNTALAAQITAGTARNAVEDAVLRQYVWSNDEPVVAGATIDEWELLIPFAETWNSGYGDTDIQPFTCRSNEGFSIKHQGSASSGSNDFEIEFTNEAA